MRKPLRRSRSPASIKEEPLILTFSPQQRGEKGLCGLSVRNEKIDSLRRRGNPKRGVLPEERGLVSKPGRICARVEQAPSARVLSWANLRSSERAQNVRKEAGVLLPCLDRLQVGCDQGRNWDAPDGTGREVHPSGLRAARR